MPMSSYSVSISILVNGATGDGFIDPLTYRDYMAQGSVPSTVNASISKVRGNQRYLMIIQQLGLAANVWVNQVSTVGADANTAPTTISFVATSEHGDGPLRTADELNPGQFLTGAAYIKRCIARALCTTYTNDYQEYYNPASTPAVGNAGQMTSNAVRYGETVGQVVVGPLANNLTSAEAVITVTQIF